jgi:hypothetical protein
VKLDVDGLEWPILQGATRLLRDKRLRSVIVELTVTDERERAAATALLDDAGLKLVSRGEVQATGTEKAANYRFDRTDA